MSSASESQTKAQPAFPTQPGSPARGSGEPGPRPVCNIPPTCLSALLPGPKGSLWAS